MSDEHPSNQSRRDESAAGDPSAVERGELVPNSTGVPSEQGQPDGDAVTSPAKVMRIGSMVKALLEEARASGLDEASRERLAEIYERSVAELAEALSPDLAEELRSLTLPFADDGTPPSESEIRVAKAQLVGWLEGLFHGIQATLFAQQMAARQQIEQLAQQRGLPPGVAPGQDDPRAAAPDVGDRTGTYL